MKILVADGSKTELGLLVIHLIDLGHEVLRASTCKQVIDLFSQENPDFVILDRVTVNLDGFECTKKIRELERDGRAPILLLSDSWSDDLISQGIDAGGDNFLTKPLSNALLAAKINTIQRMTDLRKKLVDATHTLSQLSSIDALTGVYNRFQFDTLIKEKIDYSLRYNTQLALLFINIDNFKSINDYLGHQKGDRLLQEFAATLRMCIRADDLIARLGGDEFAIILLDIKRQEEVALLSKRIFEHLNRAFLLGEERIQITCSMGVAFYPSMGKTPEDLIQRADMAMYHAKELGKNNVQYYMEGLQIRDKQRFHLENALRSALTNNEMTMNYQPIFQLHPQKMVGMEALIRWDNPIFGVISPNVFIPMAEEIGMITALDLWSINCVCKQAEKWFKQGYTSLSISINISSRHFPHTEFMHSLIDLLQNTGIPPQMLELELTESTIMNPSSTTGKTIKELAAMGMGIALDDFGTGYSSLMHLKNIPIKTLKIDKSFIADIARSSNDDLIIQSIILLAKILKIDLVAEGIETKEQLDFLIENNCPFGQGFYLSKPLTIEEISLFMKDKL